MNSQVRGTEKQPQENVEAEGNCSVIRSPSGGCALQKNKREKMVDKQLKLFQEQISRICILIIGGQTSEAVAQLKRILLDRQFLDHYEFVGVGLSQNWKGIYPKGIIQWFTQPKMEEEKSRNPFDLLSICLSIEMAQRKIKAEQVLLMYDELELSLSECFEVVVGRGIVLYNDFQLFTAKKEFMKASSMRENEKVLQYLAWVIGHQFLVDEEALQFCQKVILLNPGNVHVRYLKAFCINDKQQRNRAMNAFLSSYPYYYRAYVNLGVTEKEDDAKRIAFGKALQYDPDFGLAYCKLSQTYIETDRSKSIQYLEKASKIDDRQTSVLLVSGRVYRKLKLMPQAEDALKNCLQINPHDFNAMYELAKVYSENQDIDQSIEMLKKVIAINPYEDNSITELAEICNANNRNEEALVSFKSAIEMIEKESWYLLFRVGYLYHDIKQYSLAIPYYCDCEQLLKKDMDISFNLTDCYIKTKQFTAAKREVQKYLTYGGDNYRSIYLASGLISIGLGEYKQAVTWYFKLVVHLKQTRTTLILQNLEDKISRTGWMALLDEIHQQLEPNIYVLLQIVKLSLRLDDFERAWNTMEELQRSVELDEQTTSYLDYFKEKHAKRCCIFLLKKRFEDRFRIFYSN